MFNLSFINSFFLYGMLLVSVPIIIHLVNKKKAASLKFPTIRFILESNKRVSRRFKIRQLILLILRTLAILFIVFLFARPLIRSEAEAIDYENLSRGTVIIIDNSSSMLYRAPFGSFFNTALSSAESIITGQKNIDSAAILTTVGITDTANVKLSYNKLELLEELKGLKTAYTKSDVRESFKKAVNILSESTAVLKEIYFVSDMQANGWGTEDDWGEAVKKEIVDNKVNVYLVDVSSEVKAKNVGITGVSVLKESKGKVSVLNIFSKTRNFSDQPTDNLLIKSYVNGEEGVKGFLSLKPGEVKEKSFYAPIDESGIITGNVKLKGDSFVPDDIRYFSLRSFRTVRVLVVDGDPTTQVYSSETFYLNFGLNPLKDSYSKIDSEIVTYDEFKKEELKNFDVVLLCNVGKVSIKKTSELKRFVDEGGGLIFFPGDKVDPEKYNDTFTDLLPQKLRDIYTVVQKGDEKPFEYISAKDYSHPILTTFSGANSGNLSTAKFYKYFVLQPSVRTKSNIILEYSSGNPCLVEKRYGKGNVLLYTSTVDRDFNDLCIYPTYLPLMQQMTLYVANALGKEAYTELVIGDTAEINVDKGISDVTVIDPEGEMFYEKAEALKDISKVRFKETYLPGFYNVFAGKIKQDNVDGEEPVFTFAVNVDTGESDFTKVTEKVLKGVISENYNYIEKGGDLSNIELRYMRGEEIWTKLLYFLLVFLLLESIISTSWRKRKKVKSAKWKEEGHRI
jgi:hypothetical protein